MNSWWISMGHWRWLNGVIILIAVWLSFLYSGMPAGWTDHGSRRLGNLEIYLDTRGEIKSGEPASARLWISDPTDLTLSIGSANDIEISGESFSQDNEFEFELSMPADLTNPIFVIVGDPSTDDVVRWNLGRLFR